MSKWLWKRFSGGFTLLELVLVVTILGILATIAVKSFSPGMESARFRATVEELDNLAMAITGNPEVIVDGVRTDFGYVGDVGALPPDLDALVTNPGGLSTWNGPYVNSDSDGFKKDAWGNLYSYSGGITISSSGGGVTITKTLASSEAALLSNTVYGLVLDAVGNNPGTMAESVDVTVEYPDGAGGITTASTNPSRSGEFSIANVVPIGLHTLRSVYSVTDDTVSKEICVLPGSNVFVEVRFAGDLFQDASVGGIQYVAASARTLGGNNDKVEFQIVNMGTSPISITSIALTYSTSPSYYEKIKWDGPTVWDQNNPRLGSGETAVFAAQILAPGATATIRYEKFRTTQSGGGSAVDMSGVSFTATFSNGEYITFST